MLYKFSEAACGCFIILAIVGACGVDGEQWLNALMFTAIAVLLACGFYRLGEYAEDKEGGDAY